MCAVFFAGIGFTVIHRLEPGRRKADHPIGDGLLLVDKILTLLNNSLPSVATSKTTLRGCKC